MKKLLSMLVLAAMCLGLAACAVGGAADLNEADAGISGPVMTVEPEPVSQTGPEELPDPEAVWTAAEGVTFGLLQDTYPVGTTELTLVIENRSDLEIGWGTHELYEKYVEGQWQKLDHSDEIFFTDEMLTLQPQSVRTQTLTALRLLEPLDEGLYRVTGSAVFTGCEGAGSWQVSFRVAADAQPEPDYALFVSRVPLPLVEDCLLTERVPVFFINTTGEDANVLEIPHLEKQDADGQWVEVPYVEGTGFCGTPSRLPAEGMSWSEEMLLLWGAQDVGRYRLSYQAGSTFETEETVSCEFQLCIPEDNAGLPLAPQE